MSYRELQFLVTSEVICQWFSRSYKWKSLANHITSDQKIVIHGNEYTILFLTHYSMSWTQHSAKKLSIVHFAIVAKEDFSELTLWCHHSWSVTSRECKVLALWRHIRRLFLHAQIWCKCDLHQWITTVNIDFSPPSIHSLACKTLFIWNWGWYRMTQETHDITTTKQSTME